MQWVPCHIYSLCAFKVLEAVDLLEAVVLAGAGVPAAHGALPQVECSDWLLLVAVFVVPEFVLHQNKPSVLPVLIKHKFCRFCGWFWVGNVILM